MKRELLNVNERNLVRFILKIQRTRIIEWESKNSCETTHGFRTGNRVA